MAKDHWWINPSGLSKADKEKLQRATNPSGTKNRTRTGRQANRERNPSIPPAVLPDQYIGQGKAAEKAAREIAKSLKGAKVYPQSFGAQTSKQKLWERVAHSLINRFLKGK